MEIGAMLDAHFERFNSAVLAGNFQDMVAHFTEDAVMWFEGVPVGPSRRRDAIAAAYEARPPDDRLALLEVLGQSRDSSDVSYAWAIAPETRAGTMTVERVGDLISRPVVRFE